LTLPEHQCKPHPSTYGFRGVGNLRITADIDDKTQSIIKLHTHIQSQAKQRTKPPPSTYGCRGVGNLRITADIDDKTQSIIKLHTHIQWQEQRRDIWMDGRPHPPDYAPHTWQGFSTGQWEGNVLVVKTTHLKAGRVRRNRLLLSDDAT